MMYWCIDVLIKKTGIDGMFRIVVMHADRMHDRLLITDFQLRKSMCDLLPTQQHAGYTWPDAPSS